MSRLFGIAGIQMSVVPWDVDATVDKLTEIVNQIAKTLPWAQMLIFHELAVSAVAQFVAAPTAEPWKEIAAEPIPGPLSDRLCELARQTGKWLVPGSMYEVQNEAIYNTALVISPSGEIVAKYRKMFPWLPYESETTPGDQFCVFDIPEVGRFGLCICYDAWYPEMVRTLAWMGAEVILHPTLTATSDRSAELVLSQANAIFNQCYFVDINGVGPWGGGRSLIVDPDGRVLQQAGEGNTVMSEMLDLDRAQRAREFGTLGLCQTWKQLRDQEIEFPLYQKGSLARGAIYRDLGNLQNFGELR
jgi:predicted amidohydrolase